jgi:glycine oxidase
MNRKSADVVIIGGGLAGIATAYYLGHLGVKSLLIEKDSLGSHASGFSYGLLGTLSGVSIPGPVLPLANQGIMLHRELARSLPQETGINIEFRDWDSLYLAFTDEEVREAKESLAWKQGRVGYTLKWIEADEIKTIEPRVSPKVLGAIHVEGMADVESYRLVLAMAQAAEALGVNIHHGRVDGLKAQDGRIQGVTVEGEDISCDQVVLAMGPWSGQASSWLGISVDVRPLKGQILRLRAPGPPFLCSIGWSDNYVTSKPDGLLWTGTTEEDVGFDEGTTTEARDHIMGALLKMIPSLEETQLVLQTACLRPLSGDGLPVFGKVPGWEGVYLVTGAGRNGILLGPAMGKATADLMVTGNTDIPIEAFDPGRFSN